MRGLLISAAVVAIVVLVMLGLEHLPAPRGLDDDDADEQDG